MSKLYDVVAITGKYQDRSGNEKNRYMNCGAVIQTEKGLSLKIEGLPVGNEWNGWLMLFEPKQKQAPPPQQQPRAPSPQDDMRGWDDDSIPF